MKDELQGKLVEILTSIQVATGKAGDFAVEQLSDIAQSYITYGRVTTLMYVAVWLLLMFVLGWVVKVLWQNPHYSEYSWDRGKNVRSDGNQVGLGVFGVFLIFSLLGLLVSLNSAALVWFAPKVWLLKELAGFIK